MSTTAMERQHEMDYNEEEEEEEEDEEEEDEGDEEEQSTSQLNKSDVIFNEIKVEDEIQEHEASGTSLLNQTNVLFDQNDIDKELTSFSNDEDEMTFQFQIHKKQVFEYSHDDSDEGIDPIIKVEDSDDDKRNKRTKKGKRKKTGNGQQEIIHQVPRVQKSQDPSSISVNCCNTCGNSFPSRNKLYKHINQTGHALRVETGAMETSSTSNSRKKKKRK